MSVRGSAIRPDTRGRQIPQQVTVGRNQRETRNGSSRREEPIGRIVVWDVEAPPFDP